MKGIYATIVIKYKILDSRRSWADPSSLSKGNGTMTIGEVVKTPKTMAYSMLLVVKGDKNHYDTNDLVLYSNVFLWSQTT